MIISKLLQKKTSVLFFFFMLTMGITNHQVQAQMIDCEIRVLVDLPVCNGQFVSLSVPENENYIYLWEPGGQTTAEILVKATETATFRVSVTDTTTGEDCLSPFYELEVRPRAIVEFEQMQLTCTNGDNDNGNTAIVQATASGDADNYIYRWQVRPLQIAPGNPSLAIGLKAHLWYYLETEDSFGCIQTDSIFTEAYPNPDVLIEADPDTAYIQNPYIDFSFENLSAGDIDITAHFWEFGDESPGSDLLTPRHLYTEEGNYTLILKVFNPQGCDTIFAKEVKVLPIKLKIPNIFTPNGDGINDYFVITEAPPGEEEVENAIKSLTFGGAKPLSAYYQKTSLVIFNRQGRKVYESTNYQNDWDGGNLKDGVYFYVLQCEGFKSKEIYKGSLTIMGSRNN
jgi:PKD repeat protein